MHNSSSGNSPFNLLSVQRISISWQMNQFDSL
jgi:hypothetical protein